MNFEWGINHLTLERLRGQFDHPLVGFPKIYLLFYLEGEVFIIKKLTEIPQVFQMI